jgi:uncharacterized repeat protein (TIGR01451 family)
MITALRSRPRALALTLALVAGAATLVQTSPAQAQVPPPEGTGASATKDCPGTLAALGETITCTFAVKNIGFFPAQVVELTEESPFPAGTPTDISCTVPNPNPALPPLVIDEGDTLNPGVDCTGSFAVTIPSDRTFCNTFLADRVSIDLQYGAPNFPQPVFAGAFATEVTGIRCPADITITKTADELSKVGDKVTYTFRICNDGDVTVNRGTVTDTLLGDLTQVFPATLAPDQCVDVMRERTVAAGDPDPLKNTVTATYNAGTGIFATSDTATASDETNLFQPAVTVTKNCSPDPVQVGQAELCTIVVTNTSSTDSPALINGTIVDTLTGDLLAAGNTAVVTSNCTPTLGLTGASCTITTTRTVLATDPNPLVNTVTVHYNPQGFPNDITASATDSVTVKPPPGNEGCTPGFWKNHPEAWVGFTTGQTLESVFDVPDALGLDNATLLEALSFQGGSGNVGAARILLRAAVAALLNAASPDVDFTLTTAEVIAQVNTALASQDRATMLALATDLDAANNLGCPL